MHVLLVEYLILAHLQAANLKLDQILNDTTAELANEKDITAVLKEFVTKFEEKGDVSEQLVQEMEQEHKLLEQQHDILKHELEQATSKIHEEEEHVAQAREERNKLQEALTQQIESLQQTEREFMANKQLLEDRIAAHERELRKRSHLLEEEVQDKTTLSSEMHELQMQHDQLLLQAESDRNTLQRLRDHLEQLTRSNEHQQHLTRTIAHSVSTSQTWFSVQSMALEKQVRALTDQRRSRRAVALLICLFPAYPVVVRFG